MNRKALVIDDTPLVARILVETLTDENYEVRHATNGREALNLMAEWVPDVILLDLMLPVMDGWDFRQEQLKMPGPAQHVPIIVVSAQREFSIEASELRPAASLSKPFDLDELVNTVNRVCNEAAKTPEVA